MKTYIISFSQLDNSKVAQVGGKNASLGELFQKLKQQGIQVPDGFATTADAYRDFLSINKLETPIQEALDTLDKADYSNLSQVGKKIRQYILNAELPASFTEVISENYRLLKKREKKLGSVAVRSSATAEDLPEASFAGQHDSFMNISGTVQVIDAVHQCIASLFTDRAIKYREDHGFDHLKVALSVGVQMMVRSDLGCAGVAFTLEPETGFDQVIFINGSWGLGDNVVGGVVNADQYYVYKGNLKRNCAAILFKELGSKKKTLVYSRQRKGGDANTVNKNTSPAKRSQFVLSDQEITRLASWCLKIEEHYKRPMDIEWARDRSGELYIVQARPETVHSSKKNKNKLIGYRLKQKSENIVTGVGIGSKIAAGKARILQSPQDAAKLQKGEVLVTGITTPDWDPILHKASAIITDHGGRTSHAAIVAREMGVVAVVGTGDATRKIKDGQPVTVSAASGNEGAVFKGILEWEEEEIDVNEMGHPNTKMMLIMAEPKQAFRYAMYPVDGVGLARLEFAFTNSIGVHPMALVRFNEISDAKVKKEINRLTAGYPDKETYFTERLAMVVSTIAASFYPRPVIVRMSDFKSNEYAKLLGGKQFEPEEQNPMLGFRGASRYYSDQYREGFRLECKAMGIVRDEMKLDNVILMIPFCRTVEEGEKVIEVMESCGLKQGKNRLQIYMMIELPSNVTGCEEFAKIFDGFSIGSNDLTQLALGVDRDSELIGDVFDEQNPNVLALISEAIRKARKANRKIGLCGQAPSDFPEFAGFLVQHHIDSISFNPDALVKGIKNVLIAENK